MISAPLLALRRGQNKKKETTMKKFFMMSALFFGMACSTFAADDVTGIKLLGDANDDGKVNISDVAVVLTLINNPNATGPVDHPYHLKNADANKDSKITVSDVAAILSIITSSSE